jgi:hypothetical protein
VRPILIGYFFCILSFTAKSQTSLLPVSLVYIRTSAYSSNINDAFSFTTNQAALASNKNLSIGFYGERRFMLADLSSYCFALAVPGSSGGFGFTANYFGGATYNESSLGLAYGRTLGKIDVGARFNYCQFKTEGYGSASTANVEAGIILHLNDQLQTGVHIYNPTRASIGKNEDERLPIIYSFGVGYDVAEKVFIGTLFEKVEDRQVNLNVALQYAFERKLFAKAGVATATSTFYFGAGFLWNGFRIDVTASLHPALGISPGMLLLYNSAGKS